jgi:hypothetical protein
MTLPWLLLQLGLAAIGVGVWLKWFETPYSTRNDEDHD